jgi:periplasmic protein CpxP/Spy
MKYSRNPLRGAIAAATITIVIGLGSSMASASQWVVAQATTSPATPGKEAAAPSTRGPTQRVDARIAELREKLHITAAQEPQFTTLADVMRTNAQSMETLLQERAKATDTSAVASLKWYERLTDTHAEALKKFVPAFETFYASLSDAQKKDADAMFRRFAARPHPHRSR